MEKRNKITTIFRSTNPKKLLVYHAASLQNQIRFYINDTQYFAAIECDNGYSIRLDEDVEEKDNEKPKISLIKENLKDFIKLFSVSIGIFALSFIGLMYLSKLLNNIIVFMFIMNIVYFIITILNVIVLETMKTAPCIKSKHSAEHMMVNFLEINKRLPKNMEEVKKCSRFSPKCGSRELIEGIAETFIQSIIGALLAAIISGIIECLFHNSTATSIILIITYFLVSFVAEKLITKYGKLNFIVSPTKKILTIITQCANTTSKVKNSDIILAYLSAKAWIQVVYPEFYNEKEDTFQETIF